MGAKLIDLTGEKFGRLTVVSHIGVRGRRRHFWRCECECGAFHEAASDNLKKGRVTSCGGCYKPGSKNKTHGLSTSSTYHIWATMKARCYNPNNENFHRYGGRGITMCSRWRESFEAFLDDMGERPKGHSIDRINNDLGYGPDNCRWATGADQMRNTRATRKLTLHGKVQTLTDWAKEIGISATGLQRRIDHLNWPLEKALTQKPKGAATCR